MIVFLCLTMGFDFIVTYLRGILQRSGRQGLAAALDKVVSELTVLGFVSLLLLLFQGSIGKVCMPYKPSYYDFTIISNIGTECPCCLASTAGISKCTQAYQGCGFNSTTEVEESYCGCEEPGAQYSSYATLESGEEGQCSALPETKLEECSGPFFRGTCSEGHFKSVSLKGIEQVHILIFFVAIFHVAAAMFVVLGAMVRMRQWKSWEKAILKKELWGERAMSDDPTTNTTTASPTASPSNVGLVGDKSGGGGGKSGIARGEAEAVLQDEANIAAEAGKLEENSSTEVTRQLIHTGNGWKRRGNLSGPVAWLKESLVCVIKSFLPNLVFRQDFYFLRSVYIADQGLPPDYDFLPDLTQQLDYNIEKVAGVSLEMWIILTLVMLMMGLMSQALGLLVLIGLIFLCVCNLVLAIMMRAECRHERPMQLRAVQSRWKDPKIIGILMRSVIFMTSLTFSFSVFFIFEFGVNSCLFNAGVFPFVAGKLPWWSAMIFSGLILSWLAVVSVPAWTLGCAIVEREGNSYTEEELSYTSEKVTEDIARLQRLQRRL
jgi:Mlo family